MDVLDGNYRLAAGNGAEWNIAVHSGRIDPFPSFEAERGVIRVPDRTFNLNLWDEDARIDGEQRVIKLGGKTYPYTLETQA